MRETVRPAVTGWRSRTEGCRYLNDERQKTYVRDGWNFTGDAYILMPTVTSAGATDDMIISADITRPEVKADAYLPGGGRGGGGAADEQRADREGFRSAGEGHGKMRTW